MSEEPDIRIDMNQVMHLTGKTRPAIKAAIESGKLPAIATGIGTTRIRYSFRRSDVEAFIKSEEVATVFTFHRPVSIGDSSRFAGTASPAPESRFARAGR